MGDEGRGGGLLRGVVGCLRDKIVNATVEMMSTGRVRARSRIEDCQITQGIDGRKAFVSRGRRGRTESAVRWQSDYENQKYVCE